MDRVEEFIIKSANGLGLIQNYSLNDLHPLKYLDIVLDTPVTSLEVPNFCINRLGRWLNSGYNIVSLGLAPNTTNSQRRLVRGALSDFCMAESRARLATVTMSNGTRYHGSSGVIFNDNFDILMLMTSTITKSPTSSHITVERCNCRVSPLVFQSDNIIEKTIIKKVIPFCAAFEVTRECYPRLRFEDLHVIGTTIKVVIDDVNKDFIREIVTPTVSEFNNASIKPILIKHIEDMVR